MSTIQRISPHPRKPDRAWVHVEGEAAALLSLDDLRRLGLQAGMLLPAELLARIQQAARALATLDRARAMLARRPRAARDLRYRLLRKGEAAEDVDAAIARLQASGALDDAAFARLYARSKLAGGGRSAGRVRGELLRQGVSRELAAQAVQDAIEEEGFDEAADLQALITRRLPALRGLDPEVKRRRLFAFLQRRGFKAADALAAIRRALSAPAPCA